MRHNKLALYVHFVWTTWDRLPLISQNIERDLHRHLHAQAERHGCKVLALGGMPDHVHLLLEVPPTQSLSFLVQQLKGVSAHFVNETLQAREPLKWRGSYAAFTVSRWDVRKIAGYIKAQKEHHGAGTTIEELEAEE